jgi:hypothetical protein
LLIQMKLAVAERKRSVCTADILFYRLLTFLQCNYHRDLRQLRQRVCWPLCSWFLCLVVSYYRSSISNFVVQAAVPKTAKVSLHLSFCFHKPHLSAGSRVSQPCTAGHSFSCYGNFFVPKWRQLHYSGESSLYIYFLCLREGAASASVLTHVQVMRVSNTIVDQKPLAMRMKISYTAAGGPITKTHDVTNFPPGI